jgi:hypothetical protein
LEDLTPCSLFVLIGWGEKMDIDLALYVVRAAFRSSRELGDLGPFLKEHLRAEEYRPYAPAIASEAEVEASIQKYGRYL